MKLFNKTLVSVLFAGIILFGCDGSYDSLVDSNADRNPIPDTEVEATAGSADFSNYIAIGNSLTAGFMDGALYNNGQQNSLAALISKQLEYTGAPETFNQPDINSVNGYNTQVNEEDGPVLGRFKLDTSIPGPSPTINGDEIEPYSGDASSLNNFGVPGIQVGQLLTSDTGNPESPAFNPFYARFASAPGSSTILEDAISSNPTFFSLWIGSNDVLGYALGGATNPAILTDPSDFEQRFGAVMNTLMSQTEAQGIVANIPPLLAIPIFQAVPYNVINISESQANSLNGVPALRDFNEALDLIIENGHDPQDAERRRVVLEGGPNPILFVDPGLDDLTDQFDELEQQGEISETQRERIEQYVQARPMAVVDGVGPEIVLFTAAQVLGTGSPGTQIGIVVPLPAQFVLTAENIVEIETARAQFNGIIEGAVASANSDGDRVAFYDTNADQSAFIEIFGMDGSQPGINVSGTFLEPDFSPNGVFSTDGVHPNQRGNAILANEFLRAMEETFDAQIPRVDVLNLPSVSLCAGDCVSQQ